VRNWRQIGAGDMVLYHRVVWIKALCDVMVVRGGREDGATEPGLF